jgi:hypothetical protein
MLDWSCWSCWRSWGEGVESLEEKGGERDVDWLRELMRWMVLPVVVDAVDIVVVDVGVWGD